jgi:hypothetical protein
MNRSIALVLISSVYTALAADPTCAKGIATYDRKVCCASYCGACSTADCASRPGGYW